MPEQSKTPLLDALMKENEDLRRAIEVFLAYRVDEDPNIIDWVKQALERIVESNDSCVELMYPTHMKQYFPRSEAETIMMNISPEKDALVMLLTAPHVAGILVRCLGFRAVPASNLNWQGSPSPAPSHQPLDILKLPGA
jgi:hypothetical protein